MCYNLRTNEDGLAEAPTIPCGHVTRLAMLSSIQEDAYRYYRMWEVLQWQGLVSHAVVVEDAIDIMKNPNMFRNSMADITRNLEKARVKCKSCRGGARGDSQITTGQTICIDPDQTPGSPSSPPASSPSSSESFTSHDGVNR